MCSFLKTGNTSTINKRTVAMKINTPVISSPKFCAVSLLGAVIIMYNNYYRVFVHELL